MQDMEDAKDKVLMGPERRSMIISNEEKEIIAFHESGHTIIGLMQPGFDQVHKVTIIPRGRALGLTMHLPKEEKHLHSKSYWLNQITILFGGHMAEQIMIKDVTTGASNDIERATDIARKMVCEWGMSEKMGPLAFGKRSEQIFLGREISQHRDFSESTAEMIDQEIKKIIRECQEKAKKLILENQEKFEKIAKYLIERETLNTEEIDLIMKGDELPPLQNNQSGPAQKEEGTDKSKDKTKNKSLENGGVLQSVKP
jgi:cell division protease FtsH